MRDFQLPGRSAVYSTNGMVATSHPLASATALKILRDGGNSVDAAVAAAAVLGVVEPEQAGVGGDLFALISPKGSSDVIALDAAGTAPFAASVDWYLDRDISSIPFDGPHSVTVPGAVDAWVRLIADFGTMDLASVLAPAIDLAENGHPVHERVAIDWANCAGKLGKDPGLRAIFLPEGIAPCAGDIVRQPLLAGTMRKIAVEGRDGFYCGDVAANIVSLLRSLGGLHSEEDFAVYRSRYVQPIRTKYREFDVLQCPPSGQGITALIMLNLLSRLEHFPEPLAAERLHAFIEIAKVAYRERDRWVGDNAAPVDWLLSTAHTTALVAELDIGRVAKSLADPSPAGDTVYLTVVDRDRTVVSLIASIYKSFGSGIACPRTGVCLQDRAAGFNLRQGHPNCLAPGKRPLHTIMPGIALHEGRPVLAFGTVGGHFQPIGNALVLSNMIDYGLDPQAAIDLPRIFADTDEVKIERGFEMSVLDKLAAIGHRIVPAPLPLGSVQIIKINWQTGVLVGGSDGRTDGCAIGY
jgi:gamma-glutamyltranspeptidase / glutathione hydrolase